MLVRKKNSKKKKVSKNKKIKDEYEANYFLK
jgi:hypothetical protein